MWPAFLGLVAILQGAQSGPASRPFRAALISPGSINDHGWNASAWGGLKLIEKELGAKVLQQEVTDSGRFQAAMQSFAADGVEMIVAHGAEYMKAALAVGPRHPDSLFLVSAGTGAGKNVAGVIWRYEDAAYLAGFLAGKLSKTRKAGCVGGFQYPILDSVFAAFQAGARSVVPDFDVRVSYLQSWSDLGAGRATATAMVEQGCDFLFHNADEAGLAVLRVAAERKILAFGCIADQSEREPDAVLASVVSDVPGSFLRLGREIKDRKFVCRQVEWTLADGIVKLTLNPKLQARIPKEVAAELTALEERIRTRTQKVPYDQKPK
jgi:basic membrane protein A